MQWLCSFSALASSIPRGVIRQTILISFRFAERHNMHSHYYIYEPIALALGEGIDLGTYLKSKDSDTLADLLEQ